MRDVASRLPRPPKELKGFARVSLEPGGTSEACIELLPSAFEYYDPEQKRWLLELGEFEILVGVSAAGIRLRARVLIT